MQRIVVSTPIQTLYFYIPLSSQPQLLTPFSCRGHANRRHPVVTYRLSEWDGTPIKGTFYEPDVQKVQVSDDSLFRVEKVLKRKGRHVLVRWKGWPAKYDSWIPAQDGPRQNNASKKKKAGAVSR